MPPTYRLARRNGIFFPLLGKHQLSEDGIAPSVRHVRDGSARRLPSGADGRCLQRRRANLELLPVVPATACPQAQAYGHRQGELMGTYMVERYLPEISEEELRAAIGRVQAVAAQMQAQGLAVSYLGSTFAPEDQCCFCLFAGPSGAVVQEANERAEFPHARIVPAVRIPPED
jgi:hypothetical protein